MPVYEYRCNACGHEFEESQRITEAPIKICPKCSEEKVERLISLTAFHLKGGGWYSDLYGSSKSKSTGSDAGTKTESKSETKTETKSDSKTESKPASDTKTTAAK